ncbi:hypothetical protein Poly30_45630 [Planctomycetes bacterium Poly30]|uniref:Pyrrolo-quinoline quinone repeat domain-containing protein n=1 Tax=Saltatorellus ferox TaxID=2528018 RepID=A0A518EY48_9BACT|nr:hypothetical protein Poly30_45630 [Planctomycetes bacterium Poly30]
MFQDKNPLPGLGRLALLLAPIAALPTSARAQYELGWIQPIDEAVFQTVQFGGIATYESLGSSAPVASGGCVAAFGISSPTSGGSDALLLRRWTEDGFPDWSRTYPIAPTFTGYLSVQDVIVTTARDAVVLVSIGEEFRMLSFDEQGSLNWDVEIPSTVPFAPVVRAEHGPAPNGDIYVATVMDSLTLPVFTGRASMRKIDGSTGSILWTHEAPSLMPMTAAFGGGDAYMAYYGGGFLTAERIDSAGQVVYSAAGLQSFERPLGAASVSDDGRFFFAQQVDGAIELDPQGQLAWSAPLVGIANSGASAYTTTGDVVYMAPFPLNGSVTRFDRSGNVVWDRAAPAPIRDYAGIAADGDDGVVLAARVNIASGGGYDPSIEYLDAAGNQRDLVQLGTLLGQLGGMTAPAIDSRGNVWAGASLRVGNGFTDAAQIAKVIPSSDPSATQCVQVFANSTGQVGELHAAGSAEVAANNLTLRASQLPVNSVCLFLASPTAGFVSNPGNAQGNLCIASPLIGRYVGPLQVQFTNASGTVSLQLELRGVPSSAGTVVLQPGMTYYFQAWHRDSVMGQATSNFTSAIQVDFQ